MEDLLSLLDTDVKSQAIEYLSATPFSELNEETKAHVFFKLLEKNCFEPLYNLSLVYFPKNMSLLIKKCIIDNDACKVLMNISRVFEESNMIILMEPNFEQLINSNHAYMFGALLNISRLKESHNLILQYLPSWKRNEFTIGILKNLAFDCSTHAYLLDLLPDYLDQIVATGFRESIIQDERVLEAFDKDEISDYVFNVSEHVIDEPPLAMIELIIILLNGSTSTRQQLLHLGIYFILRHLDIYATEHKWVDVNQLILNAVELILAKDEKERVYESEE